MSDALAALHAEAFDAPWSAGEIASLIDGGALLVADDDGFVLVRVAADEAEVLTLAVSRAARRQGLGRRLMLQALDAAANGGAGRMFLEVAADNVAAIGLYRGLGFEEIAVRPRYYRRETGPAQDALIFERALNTAAPFSL